MAARTRSVQTEAAIAAVHCRAPNAADTDWREIAALYALLEAFRPIPAVRVNRAYAVSRAHGPKAGLELLDEGSIAAGQYPYVHLVRGSLLAELGLRAQAIAALELAEHHARNPAERAQVRARLAELGAHSGVKRPAPY